MNGWTTTEGINQRNIKCLSGILQTNALVVTKNFDCENEHCAKCAAYIVTIVILLLTAYHISCYFWLSSSYIVYRGFFFIYCGLFKCDMLARTSKD